MSDAMYLREASRRIATGWFIKYKPKSKYKWRICNKRRNRTYLALTPKAALTCYLVMTADAV